MNKFLATAASVLSLTASAWAAQPADTERKSEPQRTEQMRAKFKERTQEQFRTADKDGDGALSKAEAEASMPRMAKHFDAIDANKDGKITPDELRAHGEKRQMQGQQHGAGHHDRQASKRRFAERFKQADADGDGTLSRAEAEKSMPRIAKHFDEIDSNHDGKITQEEIKASMERHRAEKMKRVSARRDPPTEKK